MAAKIYHRPNTVTYEGVDAVVGVTSVSVSDGSVILPAIYDDGTLGQMPVAGAIQGTITGVAGTNPNTLVHGSQAVLGVVAISINNSAQPRASLSDAGTVVVDVSKGFVEVQVTLQDASEADNLADITTSADMTFNIVGPDGATDAITIYDVKTGAASGAYDHSTGGFVVPCVGLSYDTGTPTTKMGLPFDLISMQTTAAKDITFKVSDEAETEGTVTISNVKTGGSSANFSYGGVGTVSVNYVGDAASLPV